MSFGLDPRFPPPPPPGEGSERLHDRDAELERQARLNLDDEGVYEKPRRASHPVRRALGRLRAALGRD